MSITSLVCIADAPMPTKYGFFHMFVYTFGHDTNEHVALVMGSIKHEADVLVRVHSECMTGDIFGAANCDCGEQLQSSLQMIADVGTGILLYLRQEGRGVGLVNKLRAVNLMNEGYDTVTANLHLDLPIDSRDYAVAASILQQWQIQSIHLITNNPVKIAQLTAYGVTINKRIAINPTPTIHNQAYLTTKRTCMGHLYDLDALPPERHHDLE